MKKKKKQSVQSLTSMANEFITRVLAEDCRIHLWILSCLSAIRCVCTVGWMQSKNLTKQFTICVSNQQISRFTRNFNYLYYFYDFERGAQCRNWFFGQEFIQSADAKNANACSSVFRSKTISLILAWHSLSF